MIGERTDALGIRPVIPRANVTAWRNEAPWPDGDLVLSRALGRVVGPARE